MQMKYFLLYILLQSRCVITSAQEAKQERPAKKGCSCSFSSIIQIGALTGSKGAETGIQTVNGLRYKTWFAGIGIGLDYYSIKSYPFFLDVRKDLFDQPSTPFVYVDAGIHMPAKRKIMEGDWYANEYSNEFYSDAGVGYKIAMGKVSKMLISAGYSYKKVDRLYRFLPSTGCDFAPCYQNHYNYVSWLHRFSVKMGWQF